jgi:hypothetical protein
MTRHTMPGAPRGTPNSHRHRRGARTSPRRGCEAPACRAYAGWTGAGLWGVVILLTVAVPHVAGWGRVAGAAQPPAESRDRALLEDLAPPPVPPRGSAERPGRSQQGPEQTGGSDIGVSPQRREGIGGPLLELSRKMQAAEQKLRGGDASETTQQLQREVIDQLDQLIALFESQMQQSQTSQGAEGNTEEGEQPTTGDESEQAGDESGAGTDSRDGMPGEDGAGRDERERGMSPAARDDVWGHLPERLRQQLQNAAVERFLPKYEDLIEAFYRRLAEEDVPLTPRTSP